MKPNNAFHPGGAGGANKKKGKGVGAGAGNRGIKARNRTSAEKKERIWGKTPQKPYISSSIGDMARVMMRYACMENTYFYNQEPPPVEFYDFWQKFSVEQKNYPKDFVDEKKQSIPNLKKNTSSFNFYGRYTEPIRSHHDLDDAAPVSQTSKKKVLSADAQKLSDIWKDIRISMSHESFISASTKISENASAVPLEDQWDEECSEDYQSSESDFGFDVQDHHRHHRHKLPAWAYITNSQQNAVEKTSSLEFHTQQGLMDKQANMITQSLIALQKRDNRILVELATKPRDMDIIDHFADDLDDSFLMDSYSYSELPDDLFGPDFDFLNEDAIYKKKGKKVKKADLAGTGKKGSIGGGKRNSYGDDDSDQADGGEQEITELKKASPGDDDSSGSDCVEDPDEQCNPTKSGKLKRDSRRKKSGKGNRSDSDDSTARRSSGRGGYKACMERRRRRIEDGLRAAVRCRSPMGSYKPKKGEEPLSRALEMSSPGPAAYNPCINSIKPNIHTALLAPRWTKNIYETPGPGPALYLPNPKCTCEMLTLHETPRFTDSETVGPGPANVNLANTYGTAKDKPHALILSRKNKFKYSMGGEFTNCYGWTRFGKAHSPNALIVSSRIPDKKFEPGPGEYDPNEMRDTRVGISIKSRIPEAKDNEKSPGFLKLPGTIDGGKGFSFGIKNFMEMKDQSPGPIYQINKRRPKPLSLTFKPFPMRGAEEEPSPIEWGRKPAEAKIKVLPRAPAPILHGNHDTLKGKFRTPGPNQYLICECSECVEPGATMQGRYGTKTEITPGPADYDPKPAWGKVPMAVFQHKYKEMKKKGEETEKESDKPRGVPYRAAPKHRVVGGLMAPRWRDKEDEEEGPELLNTFGLSNHGNTRTAIPISLKSRHTPFKYSHLADPPERTFRSGKAGTCD